MKHAQIIQDLLEREHLAVDFEEGAVYTMRGWNGKKREARRIGRLNDFGFMDCCVYVDGKEHHFKISHIIWIAAHGPAPDGWEIAHINGVLDDDRLCNLRAGTRSENVRLRNSTKLSPEKAEEIRALRATGMSLKKIGKMYGVSDMAVHQVVSGQIWGVSA